MAPPEARVRAEPLRSARRLARRQLQEREVGGWRGRAHVTQDAWGGRQERQRHAGHQRHPGQRPPRALVQDHGAELTADGDGRANGVFASLSQKATLRPWPPAHPRSRSPISSGRTAGSVDFVRAHHAVLVRPGVRGAGLRVHTHLLHADGLRLPLPGRQASRTRVPRLPAVLRIRVGGDSSR